MAAKNLFDFDFTAEKEAQAQILESNTYIAEDLQRRIAELRELADRAFMEERNEAGFRILDEIDKIEEEISDLMAADERPLQHGFDAPTVKEIQKAFVKKTPKTPAKIEKKEEPPSAGNFDYMTQEITIGLNKLCEPKGKANSSPATVKILRDSWTNAEINHRESFKALFLDNALNVIGLMTVSVGGMATCHVDLKVLFQGACRVGTSAMIVCHNHPSGQKNPSPQDDNLTNRIKEACKILDISLLDHIIITESAHYSYTDNGRL